VKYSVEHELGGRKFSISTGVMARQANGSAEVRYGDTVVLAAAVAGSRRDLPFLPLTVDYREKTYAAGKIPGGFFKREGRPTTKETLTMRLTDRPIRPLFPKGFANDLQVISFVLSADQENDPDVLAVNAASAALTISDIPFKEPIGCVRVGLIDGEFLINPTHTQRDTSELDLVVAATKDRVVMVEAAANEVPEERMAQAILLGQKEARQLALVIGDLAARCGKPKFVPEVTVLPEGVVDTVRTRYQAELERRIFAATSKMERQASLRELRQQAVQELTEGQPTEGGTLTSSQVEEAFRAVEDEVVRRNLLEGRRVDGREPAEIRPITCEVGVLPRTHGSALFTRGETQAIVLTTLGTSYDEQRITGLLDEYKKHFIVHYNFPPFSVGETRPIRGPGRREIGHGALTERALQVVVPPQEEFPYTIRIVSDILESNGSSSMASICGGALSLMDAGVPIRDPVAGVAMGLVEEGDRQVILSDILGVEDHCGDMDFKIAGTQHGITALQLDVKAGGLTEDLLHRVLAQAREGRLHVLRIMLSALPAPREATSEYAPKILLIHIDPEKIGAVIGPGGRMIRKIQEETDSQIDIEDDGTIAVSSPTAAGAEAARKTIEDITADVEVGRIYDGRVTSVKNFGAFVEILPGREGLVHISELSDSFVENVEDTTKVGAEMQVKVIGIDDQKRIRLSHKAVLLGDDYVAEPPPRSRRPGQRDRGRDRSGRDRRGRSGGSSSQ